MAGAQAVGVGAGGQGQAGPLGPVVEGRHHDLVLEQLGRGAVAGVEAGVPGPAPVGAEPELDEEAEVAGVGLELAVVERLAVVGVGAGLEEQAGQGQCLAVGRLVGLVLSPAEGAGEGGEGVVAVPEVAGVGVGAGVEEEPGDGQRVVAGRVAVDAGVGEVEQRLPVERAAGAVGEPGRRAGTSVAATSPTAAAVQIEAPAARGGRPAGPGPPRGGRGRRRRRAGSRAGGDRRRGPGPSAWPSWWGERP